jgi:hypothetical protein
MSFLGCSLEFLDLLASICSSLLPSNHPDFHAEARTSHLDSLELRLRCLQQHLEVFPLKDQEEEKRIEQVAELYRLAGQIYLHRAARGSKVDFAPTKTLVEEAFSIVEHIEYSEGLWPLFIVGLEARTDERRRKILEVFSSTLQVRDAGNVRSVMKMVEAVWIQNDLCEEAEMDYLAMLNAVLSAHQILPTFL